MSSRKEEERNEKIIRGLMKLPPNRRCINCNSLGPQYVCTNFWTFICTTCSGIHREFTHRVKSVSMAKFTSQEVEALQRGGNQRAREIYLKDWETQRIGFPSTSNVDRIREFIKNVYVDKKFAGARTSDKPPRDTLSQRNNGDDNRRASSYHSYSQSPPYEHEYEERRYGKQPAMLSRKPGSDRVQYEGKISSFMYSPGRLSDHVMYEDRFANEGPGVSVADYSGSSHDHRRSDVQSPNFQKDNGFSSPPIRAVRDMLADDRHLTAASRTFEGNSRKEADGVTHPQSTVSTGCFVSNDSNSTSLKSVISPSLVDINFDHGPLPGSQQLGSFFNPTLSQTTTSSSASSRDTNHFPLTNSASSIDLFTDVIQQQDSTFMPSIDLFANVNQHQPSPAPSTDLFANVVQQPLSSASSHQMLAAAAFTENEGWATFDSPQQLPQVSEIKNTSAVMPSRDRTLQQQFEASSSEIANTQLPSVPSSNGPSGSNWSAFDASSVSHLPVSSVVSLPQGEPPVHTVLPAATANQLWNSVPTEGLTTTEYQRSFMKDGTSINSFAYNGVSSASSFSPVTPFMGEKSSDFQSLKSTNPFDLPYDSDGGNSSAFLDMGSLQAALPNAQLSTNFMGGLNPSWFPSSSVPSYMPSLPQGSSAYVGGQAPKAQLVNLPTQGPVASLGGNPFA